MAALTAGRKVITKKIDKDHGGFVSDYTIAASTTIYEGAFVRMDAGGDIEGAGSTSVEPCLGIALETVDNSAGSDGDKTCKVLVGGIIEHDVASTTVANIGDVCYCADDQTLNLTVTTNELCGWIINFISGDKCIVKMNWPGQVDV